MQICIFYKVHNNVSKCAKNQFASTTQLEIKTVLKFLKIVFFADVFFHNEKIWNTKFSWNSKYGQRSVIPEKFKYPTNTFLKIQLHKVAIFFSIFTFSCHNYNYSEIQNPFKLAIIEISLQVQLNFQVWSFSDKLCWNGRLFNFYPYFPENHFL